jgi:2-succinyl-6-hydroxy-2,4-cyclohexadiene-1-carboxylate synthase
MRPALVLHGFTGSAVAMAPLVAALASGGRTVIAIDLPGHGTAAALRPATIDHCSSIVHTAASRLGPPVHLLGYSMGGRMALAAAIARPDLFATVTTIGASGGILGAVERAARRAADEQLAADIVTNGVAWFVQHWESQPLFASQASRLAPAVLTAQREQRLAGDPDGLAASLRGMGTGVMAPVHAALASLAVPLLALAGADDTKFVALATELAASSPAATAELVADAGHAAHLENETAVVSTVAAFWARHELD